MPRTCRAAVAGLRPQICGRCAHSSSVGWWAGLPLSPLDIPRFLFHLRPFSVRSPLGPAFFLSFHRPSTASRRTLPLPPCALAFYGDAFAILVDNAESSWPKLLSVPNGPHLFSHPPGWRGYRYATALRRTRTGGMAGPKADPAILPAGRAAACHWDGASFGRWYCLFLHRDFVAEISSLSRVLFWDAAFKRTARPDYCRLDCGVRASSIPGAALRRRTPVMDGAAGTYLKKGQGYYPHC